MNKYVLIRGLRIGFGWGGGVRSWQFRLPPVDVTSSETGLYAARKESPHRWF